MMPGFDRMLFIVVAETTERGATAHTTAHSAAKAAHALGDGQWRLVILDGETGRCRVVALTPLEEAGGPPTAQSGVNELTHLFEEMAEPHPDDPE